MYVYTTIINLLACHPNINLNFISLQLAKWMNMAQYIPDTTTKSFRKITSRHKTLQKYSLCTPIALR